MGQGRQALRSCRATLVNYRDESRMRLSRSITSLDYKNKTFRPSAKWDQHFGITFHFWEIQAWIDLLALLLQPVGVLSPKS